ncbi:PRC-barrel domain-containing protein [Candidatus Saccharibacteria bacterium]|nr:PRC-barrel domain-containing protein [Candidatus Saccharibacteria bacterium]
MLVTASRLAGFPVLSLHIGGATAWVKEAIIDPRKLKIVAFYVEGPLVRGEIGNILDTKMIREMSAIGMVIDSADDFAFPGDIVKIDKVREDKFRIDGLKVVTKKGSKLGKVVDYTVDTADFRVMQIVVKRPAIKAVLDPELVISRKEIVEITNEKIVVRDEEEKIKKRATREDFVPNFVNPFRNGRYSESYRSSGEE